jgi:aminoglycoside phosphotransferase (APT) family kinase protein
MTTSNVVSQDLSKPLNAESFNTAVLQEWLEAFVGPLQKPLEIEKLPQKQSCPTYLLNAGTQRWLLRTRPAPARHLLPGIFDVEKEYRILNALARSRVSVARPIGLCLDESLLGRQFLVTEFVEGRVFSDIQMFGIDPVERSALFDAMNDVVAQLHGTNFNDLGLKDLEDQGLFASPTNDQQVENWWQHYISNTHQRLPIMIELHDWLKTNVPAADTGRKRLVHGRLKLHRFIFDRSKDEVKAVTGWQSARVGDPISDLAYHSLQWLAPNETLNGLGGLNLHGTGIPYLTDYLVDYRRRTGFKFESEWRFHIALQIFKQAAIAQGFLHNGESHLGFAGYGRSVAAPKQDQIVGAFAIAALSFAKVGKI